MPSPRGNASSRGSSRGGSPNKVAPELDELDDMAVRAFGSRAGDTADRADNTAPTHNTADSAVTDDDLRAYDLELESRDKEDAACSMPLFTAAEAEHALMRMLGQSNPTKASRRHLEASPVLSPCPSTFTHFLKTLSPHGVSWGKHLGNQEGIFKLDRATGLLSGPHAVCGLVDSTSRSHASGTAKCSQFPLPFVPWYLHHQC